MLPRSVCRNKRWRSIDSRPSSRSVRAIPMHVWSSCKTSSSSTSSLLVGSPLPLLGHLLFSCLAAFLHRPGYTGTRELIWDRGLRAPPGRADAQSPRRCRKGIRATDRQARERTREQDDLGQQAGREFPCCLCRKQGAAAGAFYPPLVTSQYRPSVQKLTTMK